MVYNKRIYSILLIALLFTQCSHSQTGILGFASSKFPHWNPNTHVFGNSITFGYGGATSWAAQVATNNNVSVVNYAVSGSQSRLNVRLIINNAPLTAQTATATMFGFNEVRVQTGQQTRYNNMTAAHKSLCAIQWTQSILFPFGGAAGTQQMTFNNTIPSNAPTETILTDWGSRTYYYRHNDPNNAGANWFNRSVTAGETISFSITGSNIAIGTWGCDGVTAQLSRIQVSVDGTVVTTYNPAGVAFLNKTDPSGTTFTQDGIINDAIVILGLTNTSHSIVLTFLDSKIGAVDYAAVLMSRDAAQPYPVWINDLPHMSNGAGVGYNYPGFVTTPSNLDSATSYRNSVLQATFPGYPIAFVPTNKYYDPSDPTQIQSDGIHPTTAGDANIAKSVLELMQ